MVWYARIPSWDVDQGIFRAWWMDPLVASLSFAFWVNLYWYFERQQSLSRSKTFMETVGVTSLGDLYSSLIAYWIGVFLWKSISAPLDVPDGMPTNMRDCVYLLSEVVTGIVLYDAVFFVLHLSMHEMNLLRAFHKRHHFHIDGNLEARDVLRHSLVDGTLQVASNILVQRSTPWGSTKSRIARVIHNVLVTWMLTESHTSSPLLYVWRRWFVGVREHRQHHFGNADSVRYQQFFGYLDRAIMSLRQRKSKTSKSKI